ncbi:hypothetical protein T09_15539 [Trichinella sp. T9]|nr:hypothetical protein T09_15539 [Trichinella sp. T9]
MVSNFFLRVDLSPIAKTFNKTDIVRRILYMIVSKINITMLTIAAQMFIAVWKQNAAEDLLAKKNDDCGNITEE